MCGIAGYWCARGDAESREGLALALHQMRMRGPDDRASEVHATPWGEVGLGHTRLSIIDLSANGRQPMASPDGRHSLVFNGEIYNYRELREELRHSGATFRTESDSEVLLAAWTRWGSEALSRLKGMFAFAIFDRQEGTLTFARDAFGIKPLYFAHERDGFWFASELPAVATLRRQGAALELQRTYDYLVHGLYDTNECSFVDGVSHLTPGMYRVLVLSTGELSEPIAWWSPKLEETRNLSFTAAAEQLRAVDRARQRRHRAQGPSGGDAA